MKLNLNKLILTIFYVFIISFSSFSEKIVIVKKIPDGIKFQPLYYTQIKEISIKNGNFHYSYFLIGNSEQYGLLAIDLTFKSKIQGLFSSEIKNFIIVNSINIKSNKHKEIRNKILSTWYIVNLKQDKFEDKDFYKLDDSIKVTVLNLFTGNDKIILPHQNKITTIFTKPQEKK